ncbi:MAG TPA: hypothetical protein PKC38_10725, partial [Chitinophagales bacterium]|nr:hypothetical protein [Chitinophagales bacterium]
ISELGVIWFTMFTATTILLHHAVYFLIQLFSINDLGFLMIRIGLSTVVSTLLIVILAFLFAKRKVRAK